MNEPQQLAACRQRAETASEAGAEHVWSAAQVGSSVVYFDWEIPELAALRSLTFLARVRFAEGERSLRIPIDVASLAAQERTADLERLHDILATRHAGLDDRYSLLRSIEWMLTISLEQTSPELTPDERQLKVRHYCSLEARALGEKL
jgi:hypothetical protein